MPASSCFNRHLRKAEEHAPAPAECGRVCACGEWGDPLCGGGFTLGKSVVLGGDLCQGGPRCGALISYVGQVFRL